MKLPARLSLIAVAAVSLAGAAAIAQPPGGPGRGGGGPYGLLQHDANADGRLTKAELETALKARFDKIDANRDGAVTEAEFRAFHEAEMKARRAESARVRFDALDANGDGQISRAEMEAARAGEPQKAQKGQRDRHRGGRGDGPGRMAGPGKGLPGDADGDGKISFADFSARGLEAFNRVDANKDGIVTLAEIQAFRPQAK